LLEEVTPCPRRSWESSGIRRLDVDADPRVAGAHATHAAAWLLQYGDLHLVPITPKACQCLENGVFDGLAGGFNALHRIIGLPSAARCRGDAQMGYPYWSR